MLTDRAVDHVARWHASGRTIPILPEACEPDERAEIFDALRARGRIAYARAVSAAQALQDDLAAAGADPVARYLAARRHMPEPAGGWGYRFYIHANAGHALALLVGDVRLLWRRGDRADYIAEGLESVPDLALVIEAPRLAWRAHNAPPGTPRAALSGESLAQLAMLAWQIDSPMQAEIALAETLAQRLPRAA